MNIRCPQCQTTFRVNPDRIPPGGARARCARCGATFPVRPPAEAPAPVGPPVAQAPAERPPAPAAAPAAPPPPPPPAAAPAGGGPAPFGARDPNARAERLARALVSDIVAYHPDRRERSLAEGTLRTEFREEIMKSWEEYVAQVGLPLAKSTPFFREALNKILARGESVF